MTLPRTLTAAAAAAAAAVAVATLPMAASSAEDPKPPPPQVIMPNVLFSPDPPNGNRQDLITYVIKKPRKPVVALRVEMRHVTASIPKKYAGRRLGSAEFGVVTRIPLHAPKRIPRSGPITLHDQDGVRITLTPGRRPVLNLRATKPGLTAEFFPGRPYNRNGIGAWFETKAGSDILTPDPRYERQWGYFDATLTDGSHLKSKTWG